MSLFAGSISAGSNVIRIAVASNFKPVMGRLVDAFEASHKAKVQLSFGSTGKLFAQIAQGAPFDVLMAADVERPKKLLEIHFEGQTRAVPSSLMIYARGRLACWRPGQIHAKQQVGDAEGVSLVLDSANRRVVSLCSLMSPNEGKAKLAIANPKLAPYGAAAVAVLQTLGVWHVWQDSLLQGQSVSQAYQFVESGSAAIGLVSYAQLIEQQVPSGQYWLLPRELHPPISQAAVQLAPSSNSTLAEQWLDFLKSDAARHIIAKYGYDLPSLN